MQLIRVSPYGLCLSMMLKRKSLIYYSKTKLMTSRYRRKHVYWFVQFRSIIVKMLKEVKLSKLAKTYYIINHMYVYRIIKCCVHFVSKGVENLFKYDRRCNDGHNERWSSSKKPVVKWPQHPDRSFGRLRKNIQSIQPSTIITYRAISLHLAIAIYVWNKRVHNSKWRFLEVLLNYFRTTFYMLG